MKDTITSAPEETAIEQEGFANRKLIRPTLSRPDLNHNSHNHSNHQFAGPPMGERRDRGERGDRGDRGERSDRADRNNGGGRRQAPAESTNAENFYYQKQMQAKTAMVLVLLDDEEIHGTIEWYDKCCLKLCRTGAPNVVVYKPAIKYMYKEGENGKK
jgi:host factor-I protein